MTADQPTDDEAERAGGRDTGTREGSQPGQRQSDGGGRDRDAERDSEERHRGSGQRQRGGGQGRQGRGQREQGGGQRRGSGRQRREGGGDRQQGSGQGPPGGGGEPPGGGRGPGRGPDPPDDGVSRRSLLAVAGTAGAGGVALGAYWLHQSDDEEPPSDEDDDEGDDTPTPTDTPTETPTDTPVPAGGTLRYARAHGSNTLDPQATFSGEDAKVIKQLYDTLTAYDRGSSRLTAGLATGWDISGMTLTLTLREGVTFHDGESFTAEDVVATYRRFVDESYEHHPGDRYISGYGTYLLGNRVTDVRASGDHEVTFELTEPFAPFLRNLASWPTSVISKAAIETRGTGLRSDPAGSGPFALEEWDQSARHVRLARHEDHWGAGPAVDEVDFLVVEDDSSRAQELVNGQVDLVDGLDDAAATTIADSGDASLSAVTDISIGYLAFNMAGFEPFRDRRVRRAMAYAIDTGAIVSDIYGLAAVPASQPITPAVLGYNEDLEPYPHDPQRASSLLADAGYADGFSLEVSTFENPRPYNPAPTQAAESVRADLDAVGVDVSVNRMGFATYLEYIMTGRHDACFLGWMTDNGDPNNFYHLLLDPKVDIDAVPDGQDWVPFDTAGYDTLNVTGWANREFMRTVREAKATYDTGRRASLYRTAGRIQHEEAPWLPICHPRRLLGVGDRVSGATAAPIGGPYLEDVRVRD